MDEPIEPLDSEEAFDEVTLPSKSRDDSERPAESELGPRPSLKMRPVTKSPPESSVRQGRGNVMAGFQLPLPSDDLRQATHDFGIGAQLQVAASPGKWPVMFGGYFDYVGYYRDTLTFVLDGVRDDYSVGMTSNSLLGVVRLQPENWSVRPYVDVLGGIWMLSSGIRGPDYDALEDEEETELKETLGVGATPAYGGRLGLDVLGNSGLGLGLSVQWLQGGPMTVPNVKSSRVESSRLVLGQDVALTAPSQFQFMLSLVFATRRSRW